MATRPVLILQQVECEGPGPIAAALEARKAPFKIVRLYRGEQIPDVSGSRAVIVMGGPMSVYDEQEYPYLAAEDAAIKQVVDIHIPYLGICLGGQLLAKALGASVTPNRVKEIGFYEVSLTDQGRNDALFFGLPQRLPVFQWHGDTFALPPEGVLLATGSTCTNQAFRCGPNAYAIQFHLETTVDMVKNWSVLYSGELNSNVVTTRDVLPPDVERRCSGLQQSLGVLLDNFLRHR